jgi:uncharacterized membrane protein YqhA
MVGLFLPLRYLLLVASLGALIGAVLMLALGGAELFEASHALLDPGATVRGMTASILGATDAFLFGIVLVIFAYAVAFGFVFDIPPARRERLPAWSAWRASASSSTPWSRSSWCTSSSISPPTLPRRNPTCPGRHS